MKLAPALLVFTAILFLTPLSQGAGKRPIVAVFQIQDKDAGLEKRTLSKLTDYLGASISEGGTFRVVPPGDVRRALLQKKKETYKQCYDQKCQIELGRELAANKSLSTSILKIGKRCVVTSQLYDLKTQTTDVSAKAKGKCSGDGLMESIDKVAAEIRAWGSGGSAFKGEDLGEKPTGDWKVGGGQEVIVRFKSEPEGAVVLVDGNLVCQQTPCSKSIAIGTHTVAMQAPKYLKRQERNVLSAGGTIKWKLKPNFGWLTVRSEPSGLDVMINGSSAGKTPIVRNEKEPGLYKVLVTSECHYDAGKKVKVKRGQEQSVSVTMKEKQGAVRVKAIDSKGNDVAADVYVDGRKVGRAPGTYKVSVCAKELEVRHKKHGTAKKALSIREREVTSVEVKLEVRGIAKVSSSAVTFIPLSSPVSERSDARNLALNESRQGFPNPIESDAGWGGGARPWDIVDGRRTYVGEWAHGLAFTGGAGRYAGEACGTRKAVIDFGEQRRFNRVIVWHHGLDQVPSACRVQAWNGVAWSDVFATDRAKDLLAFKVPTPQQWWENWSVPMDIKLPVTYGSKVRFVFDNCGIPHGWIYEVEVYDESGR
jgi:hypothetical protein